MRTVCYVWCNSWQCMLTVTRSVMETSRYTMLQRSFQTQAVISSSCVRPDVHAPGVYAHRYVCNIFWYNTIRRHACSDTPGSVCWLSLDRVFRTLNVAWSSWLCIVCVWPTTGRSTTLCPLPISWLSYHDDFLQKHSLQPGRQLKQIQANHTLVYCGRKPY